MKLAMSAVLLALAIGTPAYAFQEPDKDKEKPQQEEPKKQEPERQQPPEKEKQPQEKPQEKQPPRDNPKQDKEQADRARQADKAQQQNEKQQQQAVKQEQQSEKDRAKPDRATPEQPQRDAHNNVQPAQRDAGNRNARRIPDQDFRAHFGREHAFRVARRDDRRFNYGGYWFEYSQPWPAGWSYDDDVYVDDIDGEYYLIDPVHPGIRLLLIVAS
jgi:outer membrane biosynthesis protein TonB